MTTGDFDDFGKLQADLIIINNIVTVLNSQLPDATIVLDNYIINCGERSIQLDYTVFNSNSTDPLPANTPIAFYAEDLLIAQSSTLNDIDINQSESSTITVLIPESLGDDFTIILVVDDDGFGNGTITEIIENNNTFETFLELLTVPDLQTLPNAMACNEGLSSATFNLIEISNTYLVTTEILEFYESIEDLEAGTNEILVPSNYRSISSPQTIYIKVDAPPCYDAYALELSVENCPPHIPDGFSPNDDGANDWFNIQGLYDIFEQHNLKIFNRYGTLVFEGNNNKRWHGLINRGLNNHGNIVPVGTYYYILNLNDPKYESMMGWVYVNY